MSAKHKGSSLIEVLVALALIMIGGINLALLQRETSFMQQQLLWRWQANQWLDALSTIESSITQTLPRTPSLWCTETPPLLDCIQQSCDVSQLQEWQRQRLCRAMHRELPGAAVAIKTCNSGVCLSVATHLANAQQCEQGESGCLIRELRGS